MDRQKTKTLLPNSYGTKEVVGESEIHDGTEDVDSIPNTDLKKMFSRTTTISVEKLYFHLHKEQNIMFHSTDSMHYTLQKTSENNSMFSMWMERNKTDVQARKLLYSEFPTTYIWKTNKRGWEPRQKGVKIGRIQHVPPSSGDLYFLRILLHKKPGVSEWDELKTLDNNVYPTYRDTCSAHGLLVDEKEYNDCFTKARHWGMEAYFRSYFVMLNMCHNMSQPDLIGAKTCHLMPNDVQHDEQTKQNSQDSNDQAASTKQITYRQLLPKDCYPNFFQERDILAPAYKLTHFFTNIKNPCLPNHELLIQIGTPIICNRNINHKSGLRRGTKLQVLRLGVNIIEAEIISGEKMGNICAIPRIQITQPDAKMPFKNIKQFPVSKVDCVI